MLSLMNLVLATVLLAQWQANSMQCLICLAGCFAVQALVGEWRCRTYWVHVRDVINGDITLEEAKERLGE